VQLSQCSSCYKRLFLYVVNMLCIIFISCVTCLVNKLLQYNTSPPHRHFFKVIKVSLRSLTGIFFQRRSSPLLPIILTQQRKCATLTEKSNQLWHTEPQFLIKTCRKRFWWLNSVVSQDRRVIKIHPCKQTSLKHFMLIPISLPAIKMWLLKTNANLFCQRNGTPANQLSIKWHLIGFLAGD
jgi:hypothetical protein